MKYSAIAELWRTLRPIDNTATAIKPSKSANQMKNLFIITLFALLLTSCARTNYLPATRVERIIDTVTKTVPDSAALRALLACDSLGRVYIRALTESKGKEASQEVSFKDGELKVETKWRTQYIDRIREVHDTIPIIQKVEVVREITHVPDFFWWCFAIALAATLYLIYKLIRHFRR